MYECNVLLYISDLYKTYGIVTVAREWVLDSLTLFKLMPFKDYLLTYGETIKLPDFT